MKPDIIQVKEWLIALLQSGELVKFKNPAEVCKSYVKYANVGYSSQPKFRRGGMSASLNALLRKIFLLEQISSYTTDIYIFPTLEECRRNFEEFFSISIDWSDQKLPSKKFKTPSFVAKLIQSTSWPPLPGGHRILIEYYGDSPKGVLRIINKHLADELFGIHNLFADAIIDDKESPRPISNQVLGRKIGYGTFSRSEDAIIRKNWAVKSLKEIADILGQCPTTVYLHGRYELKLGAKKSTRDYSKEAARPRKPQRRINKSDRVIARAMRELGLIQPEELR